MNKILQKLSSKKNGILFLFIFFAGLGIVYSAPKKKKNTKSKTPVEQNEKININTEDDFGDLGDFVRLPVQKRDYFYKIPVDVINDIADGSPASIKAGLSKIHKTSVEYEENEKVLINIASEIMKIVWPSEKVNWDIPEVSPDNLYLGALESVNQGVFDFSTGNGDYFATLLPALVILKPSFDKTLYDSCEKSLSEAIKIKPDSVLVNYLMAVLLEKQNDFISAEKYIKAAYQASVSTEEIAFAYVRILRETGELKLAREVLNGIEKDSGDITILKQNAYIAFADNDFQAAELYVAKVLQQNPNDLEFVLFRARILIEKNDYIHAVSLLDMYARQGNATIDYLILRARVQLDWSKNTTAATETVEKALQLYPDNMDALMFAARISSVTDSPVAGKYADELAAQVLEKDPANQVAMIYALKGLIQRENWTEAYSITRNLISSDSINSADIMDSYVTICINLGKNNEAYEFAKKQLELNPNDEAVLQSYVFAYSKVGSRDAVLKYIESLMSGASAKMKSYLYYRRSFLQPIEDNALADLRSSLISNPRNSDSLFRLYEMYYGKKDYRKAQYYLRQVVAINPNDSSVKQLNEALTKLIQ